MVELKKICDLVGLRKCEKISMVISMMVILMLWIVV